MEAEYTITYLIPSLERLVNIGTTLIEVSLPLLVTGLVLASL